VYKIGRLTIVVNDCIDYIYKISFFYESATMKNIPHLVLIGNSVLKIKNQAATFQTNLLPNTTAHKLRMGMQFTNILLDFTSALDNSD
jgi:hypothetical protein